MGRRDGKALRMIFKGEDFPVKNCFTDFALERFFPIENSEQLKYGYIEVPFRLCQEPSEAQGSGEMLSG